MYISLSVFLDRFFNDFNEPCEFAKEQEQKNLMTLLMSLAL